MKMYEYTKKNVMKELPDEQRTFMAKKIVREVKKIAEEKGVPEEVAYEFYRRGAFDADRNV